MALNRDLIVLIESTEKALENKEIDKEELNTVTNQISNLSDLLVFFQNYYVEFVETLAEKLNNLYKKRSKDEIQAELFNLIPSAFISEDILQNFKQLDIKNCLDVFQHKNFLYCIFNQLKAKNVDDQNTINNLNSFFSTKFLHFIGGKIV